MRLGVSGVESAGLPAFRVQPYRDFEHEETAGAVAAGLLVQTKSCCSTRDYEEWQKKRT